MLPQLLPTTSTAHVTRREEIGAGDEERSDDRRGRVDDEGGDDDGGDCDDA